MNKYKNSVIQMLHDKYVEAIYQAAKIEIRGLTFPKTYEIINNTENAKSKSSWEQVEVVLGLKKAYQYVIEIANSDKQINIQDLQNINKLINKYESSDQAGNFRSTPVGISATKYIPPIKTYVEYKKIVEDTINKDFVFDDIARLCFNLTKLQPFINGNKRTCICFCNGLLAQKNMPIIQIKDTEQYIDKLINYYEDETKIAELVDFAKQESSIK